MLDINWVFRNVGRLIVAIVLIIAVVPSVLFAMTVLDPEGNAINDPTLPIPNGYCRMSREGMHVFQFLLDYYSREEDIEVNLLDFFVNCEARNNGRSKSGYGMYFVYPDSEGMSGSGLAEYVEQVRDSARQKERNSPEAAFAKIQSAGGTNREKIRLGLLREADGAFFIGSLKREVCGKNRILAFVAGHVAAHGKFLLLVTVRPYENDSTIQDMVNTQSILVQQLITPDWT